MSRPRRALASDLVANMPPSGIREFFDLVIGRDDVISLGVGEPDFATPWKICDNVIDSLRNGMTSYTSNHGLLSLRQAIASDIATRYGVEYNPEVEVAVTMGVSEGLDIAMRAVLNPGDEVVVPEPCYVSYKPSVAMAGGVPVTVSTGEEDGFKLRAEALRAAITPRTRALLVGYPSNPTGAVMTREELAETAAVADEHDLIVFSDEIYAHLTYEGTHTCFAALPGMRHRTLVLNGFSKAYAMTGWRIGYACGPQEIIDAMVRIHAYTALCASIMGQVGAEEALLHCEADMRHMVAAYDQRRRLFVAGLNEIGLRCFEPQGAFYAFPSIAATGLSSRQFARALLFEESVAAVPGDAFGECGEGYLRCTYATSIDNLKIALERMHSFLQKLQAGRIRIEE